MLPLVLLPGWGFDRRIWDDLVPLLQPLVDCIVLDLPGFSLGDEPVADLREAAGILLAQLPSRCVLLGWSLGGMLATHIAIHYPQRIAGLITVGSNLKWVAVNGDAKGEWPGASPDNFAAFFENLALDFDSTKQHFCGVITRGDRDEKIQGRYLRNRLAPVPQENFLAGLRLLDSIDNRLGFRQLAVPGLHLFGEKDVMVPLRVAECMCNMNVQQQTAVMAGCAHQPFLGARELFVHRVMAFIDSVPYQMDKKQIAQSFSKAATTYDNAAQLQRDIGDRLMERVVSDGSRRILDLGCGTGVYSARLQQRFPRSHVISLDIAYGMLQYSREHPGIRHTICADAERLPLADASIDLLFSNLAIQWCQNLPQLFGELYRVLMSNGTAMLSTFVEGTLCELREAWQAVDGKIHVNRFADPETIKDAVKQAGFGAIEIRQEALVKYHGSVKELTGELKRIGAHNLNGGRATGLTGKRKLLQMQQQYERHRTAQGLPAHYQVLYLVLQK